VSSIALIDYLVVGREERSSARQGFA
jgi:hypothetical protein